MSTMTEYNHWLTFNQDNLLCHLYLQSKLAYYDVNTAKFIRALTNFILIFRYVSYKI